MTRFTMCNYTSTRDKLIGGVVLNRIASRFSFRRPDTGEEEASPTMVYLKLLLSCRPLGRVLIRGSARSGRGRRALAPNAGSQPRWAFTGQKRLCLLDFQPQGGGRALPPGGGAFGGWASVPRQGLAGPGSAGETTWATAAAEPADAADFSSLRMSLGQDTR